VRLKMSTGMYEFFKYATESYYSSDKVNYTKKIIPVCGNKRNLVESIYKMSNGRAIMFTLNMYHTTSSALINGRDTGHFMSNDLYDILHCIEYEIQKGTCTLGNLKNNIRHLILKHLHKSVSQNQANAHRCL
jgi:hypothetical protein